ncbi:MAG TPA: response regulator transcription factor [bacterium]|nr:response regulator transcription factor [bacterium]HQG46925.1 response regulator transcription factor [bacterium]HQI47447.1 response regulator transcription factor [bacterium]HQJ64662.1 response regulator transcription factor [bacterium]
MAKILIIEDEPEMARGLRDNFEFDGHTVAVAADGEEGLKRALEPGIDLIILDVMLPKKSGLDVCRELRAARHTTPVIMLTARGQEIDKVLGLELGADDYITKPFSVRELLARVKAVLRRTGGQGESAPVQMGRLTLDFASYHAEDATGEVELTHKEFEILKYLHQHKGETISREQLLTEVWGYEASPTSRTVDNHMLLLRKKLEEDAEHPRHILTVHRVGYKYIG